ncbi:uncharacterized protein SOCE26_025230 [Sorangium cellulosum]|uniref:Sulfatase-modifying factor enzyme-like domain-containing protein n=1 Tax=Sorangium cellulosum TaxID=56 RepID=A0A2L0EP99_SORCE|nr:SUMF1/EgtB/PvdO family nonheme iron enzyme [Sorangium cellulosum]AUX41118.1 uncharacterized protein SOCE26_025230 [Sorangium cellulosum]
MSNAGYMPPGIRFSNQRLERQGPAIDVTFDIQWSGSWGPGKRGHGFCDKNWDAAWVFFKYLISEPCYVSYAELAKLADAHELTEEERKWCQQHDLGDPEKLQTRLAERFDRGIVHDFFWIWWCRHNSPEERARETSSELRADRERKGVHVRRIKRGQQWALYLHDSPAQPYHRVQIEHCQERRALKLSVVKRWRHAQIIKVVHRPEEAAIDLAGDGTGVFIYRDAKALQIENGNAEYLGITLRCVLRDIPGMVESSLALWPFGLEMVYVPEGPFWLGDPLHPKAQHRPRNCFFDSLAPEQSGNRAYQVDSEGPIDVGPPGAKPPRGVTKLLWYDNDDDARGAGDHPRIHAQESKLPEERWEEGRIGEGFPKGFAAYYVMKRQVTQGEYAAFINTLNGGKDESYGQLVRYAWDGAGSNRGTIQLPDTESNDRIAWRPLRANNHMSWADAMAFAAWAGLRPMTELEYEKACRGPKDPVPGEFAWGKGVDKQRYATVILGEEDGTEVACGSCNINMRDTPFKGGDGGHGPVRDDAFDMRGRPSRSPLSTSAIWLFKRTDKKSDDGERLCEREDRGLSHYGIAALTGNLWELCVTVGTREGRAFRGAHGLGELTEHGEAPYDELGWPDQTARSVSWRGGSWYTAWQRGFIAARPYGNGAPGFFLRSHDAGFRAVRSAPRGSGTTLPSEERQHVQRATITLRDPAKLLSWLPPARARAYSVDDKLAAALHDMSLNEYRDALETAHSRVYETALEFRQHGCNLSSAPLAEMINGMCRHLPAGSTILGIGDGIGDDHCSFLEILRYLVSMYRPDQDIKVVNAGMIGLTTPELVAHFARLVNSIRPPERPAEDAQKILSSAPKGEPDFARFFLEDSFSPERSPKENAPTVIICHAGLNDALRLVGLEGRTRIGIEETRANLRALRALAKRLPGPPRWVWMVATDVVSEKDDVLIQPDLPARLSTEDLGEVARAVRDAAEHGDELLDLDELRGAHGHPSAPLIEGRSMLETTQQLAMVTVIEAITRLMARAT